MIRKSLSMVCILLLSLAMSAQADEETFDEAWVRDRFGLDAETEITYQSETGEPLSFEEFRKHVMEGKSFGHPMGEEPFVLHLFTEGPPPPETTTFPVLDLVDLDGHPVQSESFRGHELLVNFFFAECAPCVEEIPALNEFARLNPDLRVLAITFDEAQIARQFAEDRGFEWPIVANAQEFIFSAGIYSFPSLVLVGQDGVFLGIQSGGVDKINEKERTSVEDVASLVGSLRESAGIGKSDQVPKQ
jgi:thiol-disulfide isomerase/thioredoxin